MQQKERVKSQALRAYRSEEALYAQGLVDGLNQGRKVLETLMEELEEKKVNLPLKVEIEPKVEEPEPEPAVTVDLGVKQQEPSRPSVSYEEFDKLHKRNEYLARQQERTNKQLQEAIGAIQSFLTAKNEQAEVPTSQPQVQDDLEKIAEQDWKKAVKILGREAASEVLAEERQKWEELSRRERENHILENSKKIVLERYPSLENESSEEAQVYLEVLREDPSVLSNSHGPEIAMSRMEQKLAQMGKNPPQVRSVLDREVGRERERLIRAQATSGVSSRSSGGETKIVLSQDEKEFCDEKGLPYERYAEMKRRDKSAFKEGVSVS